MSIKAIALVTERSRAKGSNYLVLLHIADYAKDDGRWAWPSASTLAWKARLTARAGRLILEKLVVDGEVWAEWDASDLRLYLHLRCICDWASYQTEGPRRDRVTEKISAPHAEKFSKRLAQLAAARHEKCRGTSLAQNSSSSEERSVFSDPSEDPSPRAREARPPSLQAYVDVWNGTTTAPIPPCTELTPKRKRLLRAVIAEHSPAQWAALCAKVEASKFLRGANDKAWVISFDWLIKNRDNALKVREGQYDNRRGPTGRYVPSAPDETAMAERHARDRARDQRQAALEADATAAIATFTPAERAHLEALATLELATYPGVTPATRASQHPAMMRRCLLAYVRGTVTTVAEAVACFRAERQPLAERWACDHDPRCASAVRCQMRRDLDTFKAGDKAS